MMIPMETIKYTVKTKVVRIVVLTVSQMPGIDGLEFVMKSMNGGAHGLEFIQCYFRA